MVQGKEEVFLFDVCGTLYKSNTTYEFIKYYFSLKSSYKYFLIKIILSLPSKVILLFLFKLRIIVDVRLFLIGFLKNQKADEIEKVAKSFVKERLNFKKILKIQKILKNAQDQNKRIVLISASIEPVIKAIAEDLKVKEYYASQLEINLFGYYSGILVNDLKGKKTLILKRIFPSINIDFTLYTDNFDDLGLLILANKAVVVSKRRNFKKWTKLLVDHRNVKIENV